eukprot:CAMPEP_0172611122 /NCGR_PEP_ID=MMETSP1068-20121228/30843_1 /TAXON_ID=35684 /ORGANISM="Pseudopedinella elastica, Strain CCMP716" /LENGTH=92 /DNA_ID=CAMNT_0013415015 /DNA_START=673 /DNA_END=950 /DNA_ORIENTATION=+
MKESRTLYGHGYCPASGSLEVAAAAASSLMLFLGMIIYYAAVEESMDSTMVNFVVTKAISIAAGVAPLGLIFFSFKRCREKPLEQGTAELEP